jgi:crossover junction endodeoxyribonuclease RuvC
MGLEEAVGERVRVLGVDPGTVRTGWGVIECDGARLRYVESGVIVAGRGSLAPRLAAVYAGLSEVIARTMPEILSLERNFLAINVQSAFRLGEARGVAMAAAAAARLALCEYTPASIKKAVAGSGDADKAGVRAAVMRLFALATEPREDESDALAAAACHGLRRPFDAKLAAALSERGREGAAAAPRNRTAGSGAARPRDGNRDRTDVAAVLRDRRARVRLVRSRTPWR